MYKCTTHLVFPIHRGVVCRQCPRELLYRPPVFVFPQHAVLQGAAASYIHTASVSESAGAGWAGGRRTLHGIMFCLNWSRRGTPRCRRARDPGKGVRTYVSMRTSAAKNTERATTLQQTADVSYITASTPSHCNR